MSQSIDVKQWLSDNQLSDALDTFVNRQICIEELLEFDTNDLQEFAHEIGLDTLQKNRFVKGIKNLQAFKLKNNNNNNNNNISNGDSIQTNYYQETTKLIEELQGAFKNADESVKFCQIEANKAFEELFTKLKIQQTKILKDINENGTKKKNEIGQQLQTMIDARIEMKQLDYKQIKQFRSMVASSTNYKIEYKYNKTALNNFLCSMHIKSSGLPIGCVMIINPNNITSNSIKISWALDSESAITEYEIQYAKFKQVGVKNKSKIKGKKKKKKSKKKKKKRSKYDSSDESDSSSSDSSTDSSSSSDSSSSDTETDNDSEYGIDEKEMEQIKMEHVEMKSLQFKSIKFKNTDKILKKNSYKLKKLCRGYCYVLRMRSKNELGWSEWSETVKVFTNNQSKWQFQENNYIWKDFDGLVAKIIQKAYDNGKKKCHFDIKHIGQSYCINFKSMEQTNVKTRNVRKIRTVNK